MKSVFADTGFWIVLLNSRDFFHHQAVVLYQSLETRQVHVVTSEMVLTELMNFFAKFGVKTRRGITNAVIQMQQNVNITVIPQTNTQFRKALELYQQREDKSWSLTDCSSFLMMEKLGIVDALAHDKHFEQAGFKTLLRNGN